MEHSGGRKWNAIPLACCNKRSSAQLKDDKKNGYRRKWGPSGELIYEAKYNMDTSVEVKGQPIDRTNTAAKPAQILKTQG